MQDMELRRLARLAEELKFSGFRRSFRKFLDKHKERLNPSVVVNGISDFVGQEIELNTGEWTADEHGVRRYGGDSSEIWACAHPIMPVRIMRSIDTRTIKYTLAWRRLTDEWEFIDVSAEIMAQASKIVGELAKYGISVSTGDRANNLVDYLRDMIDKNQEVIPKVKSISSMGWNEDGFSPYVSGIEFDNDPRYKSVYNALAKVGSMDKWLAEARDARTYSITAKIVLAASFAAPLIEPLGVNSFFVHLWAAGSGTGKTVAQMLGAAVWGNPKVAGPFFPTFKATEVGIEQLAGFLHSIPVFMDDFQLAKDSSGKTKFSVYDYASGGGKLRSNKSLGIADTRTWATVFITGGEGGIVKDTEGEGALNRVIEIECYADHKVIKDGHKTSNILKGNYGHAGEIFIKNLLEPGQKDRAMELYEDYFRQCLESDTTDKQAMAAAVLLTADHLATEWIMQDGRALTVDEIGEFLKTKEQISIMERGYNVLCDWVAVNSNKLRGYRDDYNGDVYGIVEDGVAYIIRGIFEKVCSDNALEYKALLSHFRSKGLIICGTKGFTKTKRFGSGPDQTWACICLKLPSYRQSEWSNLEKPTIEELPF